MGPPSYMRSVVDQNFIMRCMTVYVGCKAIRFLAVSYGSVDVMFTQQNKSQLQYVFFLHLIVNSTKVFIRKNFTDRYNFIATGNLSVF